MLDNMERAAFTASDLLLETLVKHGVDFLFCNFGSDHPAIIETLAKSRAAGADSPFVIVCPHEMVALSAAHGYSQATGRPSAVLVHVDVGTQNLGGALHNALRGRVPVLILAGASPVTLDGERIGSRNEFIHYLQDVFDQRGFVRETTKWNYDVHVGDNIDFVVERALQLACSDPKGPVYIMAPREILEQPVPRPNIVRAIAALSPAGLSPDLALDIASTLAKAHFPLIITSYLGRNPAAVEQLIRLADLLAVPVIEAGPTYMNFPASHPMHLGYEDFVHPNEYLSRADVVLVFDSDIPWMPQKSHMKQDAKLYWIDCDPIKERIPLWYYSRQQPVRADAETALRQILDALQNVPLHHAEIEERRQIIAQETARIRRRWKELERPNDQGRITPEFLTATVREVVGDEAIVVNETISNYSVVWRHLPRTRVGTLFGSGASSLGWHGGAAIGVKLAHPDKTVVALTGDGSYLFSVPSAVHWVARRYGTPFLTVIYNNGGWKSPKLSTLAVHPNGAAHKQNNFHVSFEPLGDLEKIAEAMGGAYGVKVMDAEALRPALEEALAYVQNGRSAVVNVLLPEL